MNRKYRKSCKKRKYRKQTRRFRGGLPVTYSGTKSSASMTGNLAVAKQNNDIKNSIK